MYSKLISIITVFMHFGIYTVYFQLKQRLKSFMKMSIYMFLEKHFPLAGFEPAISRIHLWVSYGLSVVYEFCV